MIAMIAMFRSVRSTVPSYFWVITMIAIVTAAPAASRAIRPRAPKAIAAAGRPSRFMSANLEAPRIAIEKISVTPTPATKEETTVFSNAWVSTIVASMILRSRDRGPGANAPAEGCGDECERSGSDDDGPRGASAEDSRHAVGQRADRGGGGHRHQPRGDDVPSDAPPDGREALTGARAHDAAADHLRGRERKPVVRRRQDHGGPGARRREPLRRVHADDAGSHGPDNSPPPGVGAEGNRARRAHDHPGRRIGALRKAAVRHQ